MVKLKHRRPKKSDENNPWRVEATPIPASVDLFENHTPLARTLLNTGVHFQEGTNHMKSNKKTIPRGRISSCIGMYTALSLCWAVGCSPHSSMPEESTTSLSIQTERKDSLFRETEPSPLSSGCSTGLLSGGTHYGVHDKPGCRARSIWGVY